MQIDGLAIGASSSGFAAEIFMTRLEIKAINTFIEPPKLWRRYVDDTFAKLKKIYVNSFLQHLNNQHPRLKFTTEMQEDNKLAFLENLVHVLEDRTVKISIYRKATHTDQYLDFRSNHHIKQKIGIIDTFQHRIRELVTTEEDKKIELNHVKKALKRCGHPNWSLNKKKRKGDKGERIERRGKVVLPYVRKVSENIAKILKRHNIETIHKPSATLKNLLCNKMKDKVENLDKTGAVYYNECVKEECLKRNKKKSDYVGETERVNRERQYEHRIIDHKTAKRSASIDHPEDKEEEEKRKKEEQTRKETEKRKTRSSTRSVKRKDYKTMNEGPKIQTEGSTEFSAHVATDKHEKSDLKHKILCIEYNWFKRGVKEAIAIRK